MGQHHAPTRRTRRLIGASLAAGALTLTIGGGTAWAGDHGDHPDNPDNPDSTNTECGALEPGDALIAAPVCAPVHVIAPVTDLLDADVLGDTDTLLDALGLS